MATTIDHAGAMTMLHHCTLMLVPTPKTLSRRAEFDNIANKEKKEEMKWVTTTTMMGVCITLWGGVGD